MSTQTPNRVIPSIPIPTRKPLSELPLLSFLSLPPPSTIPSPARASPMKSRNMLASSVPASPAKRRMGELMKSGRVTPRKEGAGLGLGLDGSGEEEEGQKKWEVRSPARRLFVDAPVAVSARSPILLNPSPLSYPIPLSPPAALTTSPTTLSPPTRALAPSPPILDRPSSVPPLLVTPTTPSRRPSAPSASPGSTPRASKKPRTATTTTPRSTGKGKQADAWDELSDDEMTGGYASTSASSSRSGSLPTGMGMGGEGNADPHACGFLIYSDENGPSTPAATVVTRGFTPIVGEGGLEEQENVPPPTSSVSATPTQKKSMDVKPVMSGEGEMTPAGRRRPVLDPESPFVVKGEEGAKKGDWEGDVEMKGRE